MGEREEGERLEEGGGRRDRRGPNRPLVPRVDHFLSCTESLYHVNFQ